MNCALRLRFGLPLALLAIVQLSGQRIGSTGQVLPYIADQAAAQRAETELAAHPENLGLVGQLLDYYLQHWRQPEVHAPRLRLILWTIADHPDIRLGGGHDPCGLFINPDERNDYDLVRRAWLDQIALHARDEQVLANAARCLRLTERENAASWLRQAIQLDSREFYVSDLGDVYADAICGVSGMNPWEGPTSVDFAETQSSFARQAGEQARMDAELATRTDCALHLCSEGLGRAKLSSTDYDSISEQLLIHAADLDYPNPAKLAFLGPFYGHQERKTSGRLSPKWRIVEIAREEQAKRFIEGPTQVSFTDQEFHSPVTVPVQITIGIDGHVWNAEALGAPQIAGPVAAASVSSWIYQPLRIDGEPVRVSMVVQVTVEPLLDRRWP